MIVDVNVSLGNWPFQEFDVQTPAQLASHMKKHGIGEAWVSSIDAVLASDLESHDGRLFEKLRGFRSLRFVKTVNPTLANWEEGLAPWMKRRRVRAVKLLPNYHRYSLTDPCSRALARTLSGRGIPVLVQMRLEDERNQNPLMKVPGVPCVDVVALAKEFPRLRMVALCTYRGEVKGLVSGARNISVDLSFLECMDTVKTVLKVVPAGQLVFGSHTQFLYTKSAAMKLEYANASAKQIERIACQNARGLAK